MVDTILALGASWLELSGVAGELDGVVGVAGIDQRVEIKDGARPPSERALTLDEKRVFEEWRGRLPVVLETTDDAIALVARLRAVAGPRL